MCTKSFSFVLMFCCCFCFFVVIFLHSPQGICPKTSIILAVTALPRDTLPSIIPIPIQPFCYPCSQSQLKQGCWGRLTSLLAISPHLHLLPSSPRGNRKTERKTAKPQYLHLSFFSLSSHGRDKVGKNALLSHPNPSLCTVLQVVVPLLPHRGEVFFVFLLLVA